MKKFYFTFCNGHEHQHSNCYHVIEAEDSGAAQKIMFERFGSDWFTNYPSAEAAGVERFNLREILWGN